MKGAAGDGTSLLISNGRLQIALKPQALQRKVTLTSRAGLAGARNCRLGSLSAQDAGSAMLKMAFPIAASAVSTRHHVIAMKPLLYLHAPRPAQCRLTHMAMLCFIRCLLFYLHTDCWGSLMLHMRRLAAIEPGTICCFDHDETEDP